MEFHAWMCSWAVPLMATGLNDGGDRAEALKGWTRPRLHDKPIMKRK